MALGLTGPPLGLDTYGWRKAEAGFTEMGTVGSKGAETGKEGKSKHELDCVLRSPGWTDPALGVLRLHSLQWVITPQLKKEKNQFWVSILDAP